MVEIRDGKKVLITPVSADDLKDIHIGDIVYLDGSLTTCRDVAHRRVVEEGRDIPVDVRNNAIFHAGPIIRPLDDDKFEMVSVGPTTSMRMEKFEYDFVKATGVRVIVDIVLPWIPFHHILPPVPIPFSLSPYRKVPHKSMILNQLPSTEIYRWKLGIIE